MVAALIPGHPRRLIGTSHWRRLDEHNPVTLAWALGLGFRYPPAYLRSEAGPMIHLIEQGHYRQHMTRFGAVRKFAKASAQTEAAYGPFLPE